jgi:hypothetical protein
MNMAAFWDIAPCRLVRIDRRFRGAYFIQHQGDPETSVSNDQTARCSITEDGNLYTRRRENLKSHLQIMKLLIV